MLLWVVGGVQDRLAGVSDRDHRPLYGLGRLGTLDTTTGAWTTSLDWRDDRGDAHALKGVSACRSDLLLAAEGVVLRWSQTAGVVEAWRHPWLADTHHALAVGDAWWATSTATDTVLCRRGDAVRWFPMAPGAHPDRRVRRTRAHPNHLFRWRDGVWATRLHQRDAVEVGGDGCVALGAERVHDGVLRNDLPWCTAVDGHLVQPGGCVDLAPIGPREPPLGWCRGLAFHGDIAWVGFSRLRATRWRSHLAWVRGQMRGRQEATVHPTRVAGYDLVRNVAVADWPVPLDAVFGLLPVTGQSG